MDDYLGRYDKIQKLNRSAPRFNRASDAATMITLFVTGISIGLVAMVAIRACDKAPEPVAAKTNCNVCHTPKQAKMAAYFTKNGSKTPQEMAYAVLNTRSPRLLAAVAVVESGGNPTVRNTGYKRRHNGAFQVNPRHWGAVPEDAAGQALQAERIITELTTDYGIKKALSVYGGDSTDKYQRRILAELQGVPR